MIGNKIRELRLQRKLSQTELSNILHVSQQTVTKWENGKAEPSGSAIKELSKFFNVSADYLLGNTQSENVNIDLKQDPTVISYGGKPVSSEDMEIIKAILERHNNE